MQDARLAGRLQKELKMLQDPPPGVCVWPVEDSNLCRLEAQIQGPDGTVYAKGIFKLEVDIPDRYPFEPPNLKFITPVYHPNIDSGGRICHDILNMPPKGQWRPSLNIGAVLASIRVLLEEPNHDDGLMSDISAEYKHNRALFDIKARQSTELFAMENSAQRDSVACRNVTPAQAVPSASTSVKPQVIVSPTVGTGSINHNIRQYHCHVQNIMQNHFAKTGISFSRMSDDESRDDLRSPEENFEAANQDTVARPVLKEVNRMGASKVALDEPITSASGKSIPTSSQGRPCQNFTAKLSLKKGCMAQETRTSSLGAAREPEPSSSLSFSSQKERAVQSELCHSQKSPSTSQAVEWNGSAVASTDKKAVQTPAIAAILNDVPKSGGERLDVEAARDVVKTDAASCSFLGGKQPSAQTVASPSSQRTLKPDEGNRLMLPKTMKSLKLSRPPLSTTQGVQEITQSGRTLQGPNIIREGPKKEPVIILDSESDDEDCTLPARLQGVKRKQGCA